MKPAIRREFWILPAAAVLVLIADQIAKRLVTLYLGEGQSWNIAPWLAPIFSITHVTNTGAAFGMFQNLNSVFIVASIAAVIAILLYYRRLPAGKWPLRLALGLALGGAVGNLIDRVRQGFVIDFIDANFWLFKEFPVFNIADSAIVVGVALLAVLLMWEERREQENEKRTTKQDEAPATAPGMPGE